MQPHSSFDLKVQRHITQSYKYQSFLPVPYLFGKITIVFVEITQKYLSTMQNIFLTSGKNTNIQTSEYLFIASFITACQYYLNDSHSYKTDFHSYDTDFNSTRLVLIFTFLNYISSYFCSSPSILISQTGH